MGPKAPEINLEENQRQPRIFWLNQRAEVPRTESQVNQKHAAGCIRATPIYFRGEMSPEAICIDLEPTGGKVRSVELPKRLKMG